MSGARKRFSKELWKENHAKAVKSLLPWLGDGWDENHGDRFGPDIKGPNSQWAEVEIKQHWEDTLEFPFETVNLPQRKGKWLSLRIKFYVLSKGCKYAIQIPKAQLKDEYLVEVPNKYVFKGEYFYQIPVKNCKIIKL